MTAVANGECTITTYVTAKTEDAEASELSAAAVEAADSEETDDSVATMPEDLAAMDSAFGVVPEDLKAETTVTVTTNVESVTLDKTEGCPHGRQHCHCHRNCHSRYGNQCLCDLDLQQ